MPRLSADGEQVAFVSEVRAPCREGSDFGTLKRTVTLRTCTSPTCAPELTRDAGAHPGHRGRRKGSKRRTGRSSTSTSLPTATRSRSAPRAPNFRSARQRDSRRRRSRGSTSCSTPTSRTARSPASPTATAAAPSEQPHTPRRSRETRTRRTIGRDRRRASPSFAPMATTSCSPRPPTNLVYGDGNTPAGRTGARCPADGSDAFVVERTASSASEARPATISPAPRHSSSRRPGAGGDRGARAPTAACCSTCRRPDEPGATC